MGRATIPSKQKNVAYHDEVMDQCRAAAPLQTHHTTFSRRDVTNIVICIVDRLRADKSLPVQIRVYKSLRLWSFYVDMEESIGTVESTKAVYDKILELKIANPQIIVNYANFLEENKFFEESYKVYERGIDLFGYPIAFELWNTYLLKFINRFVSSSSAFCGTRTCAIWAMYMGDEEKLYLKELILIEPFYLLFTGWNETRASQRSV